MARSGGQFEAVTRVDEDFTRDPIAKPMLAALLFHCVLILGGAAFAYLQNLFPHNLWGGANEGDAIAVQLVSSALPLPAVEKPNDNVLATETPSKAPAPPAPPAKATVDEKAIPIPLKTETPKKVPDKKQQEVAKPLKPVTTPQTSKGSPHTQPTPKQDNRAQFGEQSSTQMQRSVQQSTTSSSGQVNVNSGSKGFNYPFYIQGIQRKFAQNTYRGEVDPRTPAGSRAFILFTIHRDGSPADVRMDKSSGSPTLDQACVRAARRVDTFGPLPSPTSDGDLSVSYYCDY